MLSINKSKFAYTEDASLAERNRIFDEVKLDWSMKNVKLSISEADMWRTKFCGDCAHHKPATLKNSSGYTSCNITDASVYFGMKCNINKWQPIIK
jgi:hypothetical protein